MTSKLVTKEGQNGYALPLWESKDETTGATVYRGLEIEEFRKFQRGQLKEGTVIDE